MVFPKDYSWGRFSLLAAVSQGHRIIWIPSATGRNKGLYGKIQVLKPTQQKNCGTMFLPLFKCKSWCFGILSFKYLFLLQECFYYVILHMHDDDKDKTDQKGVSLHLVGSSNEFYIYVYFPKILKCSIFRWAIPYRSLFQYKNRLFRYGDPWYR